MLGDRPTSAPPPVDLSWGRSFADGFPHEYFGWLRREQPVSWHEPTAHTPDGEGFWVVSRYAEAVAMMKDPATFSSGRGGTAINDSPGAGVLLNQTDDPQHRRLRALVNKGFTPRTIGRLEEDLRARSRRILDEVPVGEPFDFIGAVAQELPLQAICGVLGVPLEDRRELARLVNDAIEAETGEILGADQVRLLAAYGGDLVRAKRERPGDDILSIIVHARDDDGGGSLTDREVKAFFTLLFPAGAETTRSAIGGAVTAFVEFPDELARLRSDPGLLRSAVEEIVRWTSPSVYKRRTATRDVELAGRRIAEGQKVTYWEASANRDEAVFTDPFRFDIGRDPNPHVGFGLGTHFCLGASLARLEIGIMVEELLGRFERFELAGRPTWARNNRLVGLTRLPLIVHGGRGGARS